MGVFAVVKPHCPEMLGADELNPSKVIDNIRSFRPFTNSCPLCHVPRMPGGENYTLEMLVG
jgi:hypothetical protein